jgi:hypothetical protein
VLPITGARYSQLLTLLAVNAQSTLGTSTTPARRAPTLAGSKPRKEPNHSKAEKTAGNRARAGVIKALYPDGVPDQAVEPNAILFRRVGAKLKESNMPGVSDCCCGDVPLTLTSPPLIRRAHVLEDDGSAQRFGIGRTDPCWPSLHNNLLRPSHGGCASRKRPSEQF